MEVRDAGAAGAVLPRGEGGETSSGVINTDLPKKRPQSLYKPLASTGPVSWSAFPMGSALQPQHSTGKWRTTTREAQKKLAQLIIQNHQLITETKKVEAHRNLFP